MFPIIGTTGRWDVSKWGKGDVWGGARIARLKEDLQKLLFPGGLDTEAPSFSNKINDIDHLIGHLIHNRDVFITDDKRVLKKADGLRISPGIEIMSPVDFLSFINSKITKERLPSINRVNISRNFHNENLQGTVTFNYAHNNGRFAIGSGLFLFETMWTHASQNSIHTYKDPPSLDGLAKVKDVQNIENIADATVYDFEPRSRTIDEGQIVVLKNVNGYFAALKVIDVKYEDRGDNQDELTFEYAIQVDGSADFSNIFK